MRSALASYRATLRQIGSPDRSSTEFGFAENFRQWKLWDQMAGAHPHGVTFVIGQSAPRDWPFEMAVTQNADQSWRAPIWRVEFVNPSARSGQAWLTLAMASAESESAGGKHGPELRLSLNGAPLATIGDLTSAGGAWVLYQLRQIQFDAVKLKESANTLTLELSASVVGKELLNPWKIKKNRYTKNPLDLNTNQMGNPGYHKYRCLCHFKPAANFSRPLGSALRRCSPGVSSSAQPAKSMRRLSICFCLATGTRSRSSPKPALS